MRITIDNFYDNIEFITCFLQLFVLFEKKNFTFFGGIVRDLIVPFSILQKDDPKLCIESFKKLVKKTSFIDLNDLDIWIRPKDYRDGRDTLHSMGLFRKRIDNFLNDLNNTGIWRFIQEPKPYGGGNYAESFLIKSEICDFDLKLDFVSNPSLDNIDFSVNNLTWSRKNGFSMINKSQNNIDLILGRYDEDVGYFENKKRDEILCMDIIFKQIMLKKCFMLKMSDLRKIHKKTIVNRYLKMISKGYKIQNCESFKIYHNFKINDLKNIDNMCSICMFEICPDNSSKQECIIRTTCKHLFHAKCIFTWWSSQNHANGNLVGTCPLDRTQHIIWNV